MALTYDSIATVTLGTNTTVTTFSSIPQTYTDLRLVCYIKPSAAGSGGSEAFPAIIFNGSTAAGYGSTSMSGNGAGSTQIGNLVDNGSGGGPTYPAGLVSTSFFSSVTFDIFNYTNASTQQTYLMEIASDANGAGWSGFGMGLWTTSAAVSSIGLYWAGVGKSGVTGSTATLYGIKAA
jgi:hypothetical protein